MSVGDKMVWYREARGGYGAVDRIPVTVVAIGDKRGWVKVRAPLRSGGERLVWVSPENLEYVVPAVARGG